MDADEFDAYQKQFTSLVARIPPGWFRSIDIGPGWADMVCDLDRAINALDPDYELHQCKEKFGGLRYYIQHSHTAACKDGFQQNVRPGYWTPACKVETLVNDAEKVSYTICDVCGKPGVLRSGGWLTTRCDEHSDGRPVAELTNGG